MSLKNVIHKYGYYLIELKKELYLPPMHGMVIINEITRPRILSVRFALVAKNIRNMSTRNRTINRIISAASTPDANGSV